MRRFGLASAWTLCRLALLLVAVPMSSGCSLGYGVAAWGAADYLEEGVLAFQRESDVKIAAEGIPANFKLLEVLLLKTPDNARLLALASQYLATYNYAFVEPSIEVLEVRDPEASLAERRRASELYLRCRDYGMRALSGERRFQAGLEGSPEELEQGLESLGRRELPALFWTAFCWGSYVNLNLDEPSALADSGRVSAMMTRVLELDETYFYGGAHLFFGALLSRLPAGAGGDPVKSRRHFERAMAVSGGRLLMTKVFFARYYAVRVQERALFEQALGEVLAADLSAWPDERLANELAKTRAGFYLEHADEYFLAEGAEEAGALLPVDPGE